MPAPGALSAAEETDLLQHLPTPSLMVAHKHSANHPIKTRLALITSHQDVSILGESEDSVTSAYRLNSAAPTQFFPELQSGSSGLFRDWRRWLLFQAAVVFSLGVEECSLCIFRAAPVGILSLFQSSWLWVCGMRALSALQARAVGERQIHSLPSLGPAIVRRDVQLNALSSPWQPSRPPASPPRSGSAAPSAAGGCRAGRRSGPQPANRRSSCRPRPGRCPG